MSGLLDKLPSILVLGILAGTFLSLRRYSPSPRMRLWVFAWALVFLHFLIQGFEGRGGGVIENVYESIDLAALEIGGVIFAVSMQATVEDRVWRRRLLWALVIPITFHAVGSTFGWHANWALALALAVPVAAYVVYPLFAYRRLTLFHMCVSLVIIVAGEWSVWAQLHGDSDPAVTCILTLGYGLAGVYYWRRATRLSTGTFTVVGGFLCWGAVFPAGLIVDRYLPHLPLNSEIWNVPKFFVAFGMILSLLEEKAGLVEQSSAREHAENAMLEQFSRVTSGLLAARDPAALCGDMASAITTTSSFRIAGILLANKDGQLTLAGWGGLTPAEAVAIGAHVEKWPPAKIEELCREREPLAENSFRVGRTGLLPARATFFLVHPDATGTTPMAEVIVPLIPGRGRPIGWIWLCAPEEGFAANHDQIVKIEMLAADLAVTLENTRLHRQLVRSEKLAALGQLVAGVAHELNNPLAAVIGYGDLLAEEAREEKTVSRLTKLGQEARRMKRIVEGLLRFARQRNPEEQSTNFEVAVRDAILLREYHLRTRGIQVFTDIQPDFPSLAIGEDELKQVLLNLLNNSVDAIEDSKEKVIRIHAECHGDRVEIRVEDSGPGFADINRAMDPFYTTKPVGKGTGLGLSICYGIVQECAGDITLSNRQPYGATVTIQLPVSHAALSHA